MLFYEFRLLATGVVIGYILSKLSSDYIVISRRKYDKYKKEQK